MNFAAQRFQAQVIAQERGSQSFSQLPERLVGWVLRVMLGKAPQDRFGVRCSEPQRRCEFDQFVILLFDDLPINSTRQDRLKIGIFRPILRPVQSLLLEILKARQKCKTQRIAEGEADFALSVGVDVLLFNVHLGVVAQHPFDRIDKTIHALTYIDDETKRRRILNQLNKGEDRHKLARAVFHGKQGELRQRYREGQEDQLGALGLVVNMIVLWNTLYINAALEQLAREGHHLKSEDVARLSPLVSEHINLLGRYAFSVPEAVTRGELRPLRNPDEALEEVP